MTKTTAKPSGFLLRRAAPTEPAGSSGTAVASAITPLALLKWIAGCPNPYAHGNQIPRRCRGILVSFFARPSGTDTGLVTKVDAVASSEPEGELRSAAKPTRLTGADALRLHSTLAGGLAICVTAFVIELLRALGGHSFSWMYVFEWPLFAGFALYMWWNLLQGNDRVHRRSTRHSAPTPGNAPDEGLDAWNLYLQVMEAAEGEDPARPA